jgi:exonuclease III
MFENTEISISSINCNSLNKSNTAKWNQTLKICGISKLKSDIIFLSDIRIINKNLVSSADDIKKLFLNNPYEKYNCFFNSTKNKRGVGILIKQSLQFRILDQINSQDENILALRIHLKNTEVMLISIYGPNNTDPGFFNVLSDILRTLNDVPVILGGDWNATLSTDPVQNNIDVLNMARLPNLSHSNKISDLLVNFNLSDPFRFFYPDRKEYSHVPRYNLSQNKSRLDFFFVSDSLLDFTSDCLIHTALQNKLFNHKAVSLLLTLILTAYFTPYLPWPLGSILAPLSSVFTDCR